MKFQIPMGKFQIGNSKFPLGKLKTENFIHNTFSNKPKVLQKFSTSLQNRRHFSTKNNAHKISLMYNDSPAYFSLRPLCELFNYKGLCALCVKFSITYFKVKLVLLARYFLSNTHQLSAKY